MRRSLLFLFTLFTLAPLFLASLTRCSAGKEPSRDTKNLGALKAEFVDQRFGMFICYNIMSYGAKWGEAGYPVTSFNPEKLDCNQWAEAAVSAGMTYGLLTTKHHEGFCLWDSKFTEYDVASTPYQKDIVRQYADAFRSKGLGIGLYFSIWDSTHGIDRDCITPAKLEMVLGQITELLTGYGKVDYFVMDGWFWRMGHKDEIPYHVIRDHIKSLQPECLITDHTHLQAPYHLDIPYYEGPFGAFPEPGNSMASALGHCSVRGNGWFWDERTPDGMFPNDGADTILSKLERCEARYCNFMLNCMPNRDGLLDTIYLDLLAEIGKRWKPDASRPPLPDQGPLMGVSYPIQQVSPSSGNAEFLFDATQVEGTNYTDWESGKGFPQSIIIDLGEIRRDVDLLTIVHKHRCKPAPETYLEEGNIMKCRLYSSTNNKNFTEVATGAWKEPAAFRSIQFPARELRYLKLEILEAVGNHAIITELEAGKSG
jgi:alpha-L-fucosidase